MRTSASILAVLMAVAMACSARAEVLIGFAGSLTGGYAWGTEQHLRGAEKAVADLNARGGVLGEEVRVITADDHCDGEQAIVAAKKLVVYGVIFVVGHICSGASIPASKVYADAGILMISPGSTNPTLTEQGFQNVFRMVGRDDVQGTIAGNYLADRWANNEIAILHDGEAYGRGLAEETKRQLNARGVDEVLFAQIEPGHVDYADVVEEMRSLGVDVLYYAAYSAEAGLIIRQARDAGYDLQLVGGDGISTEDFSLAAGSAAEGTLITSVPDPRNYPEAASIVTELRSETFEPRSDAVMSYAAVQVWVQAAEKAGTFETNAVTEALRTHEFDTVLGTIGFDEKGDVQGFEPFVWYVWKGGEYVLRDEKDLTD